MMNHLFTTILITLITLTGSGCEYNSMQGPILDYPITVNDDNPAVDKVTRDNVTFVYMVTDMQGHPQSTFLEGENFRLNFIVKNQGEEEIDLGDWIFPSQNQNFFAMYKKTQEENGEVLIGKSYRIGG